MSNGDDDCVDDCVDDDHVDDDGTNEAGRSDRKQPYSMPCQARATASCK